MPNFAPLRAQDYQDPNDDARRRAEAADHAVAAALDDGWDAIQDQLDVASIAASLAAGGWASVRLLVPETLIIDVMRTVTVRLVTLQNDVAAAEMATIPSQTAIPLTFDPIAPAVVAEQQAVQSAFTQRLADTVSLVIDQDVRDGLTNGMSPEDIARTIKATIGLTDKQAAAVANFRRLLENGDVAALDRVLRDKRFDASVRRAIEGQPLDAAKIDRMVQRYAERYQAHRALTIARTEAMRAANAGRRAAWEQYADRTGIGSSGVRRFWLTAADERVCPFCRSIPLLNAAGVALDEDYISLDGPVRMPPDPHPTCRCTERFTLASTDMQRAA